MRLGNFDAGDIPLSTRRVKSSCDCHPRTCAQEPSKQPVASRATSISQSPTSGSDRIQLPRLHRAHARRSASRLRIRRNRIRRVTGKPSEMNGRWQ